MEFLFDIPKRPHYIYRVSLVLDYVSFTSYLISLIVEEWRRDKKVKDTSRLVIKDNQEVVFSYSRQGNRYKDYVNWFNE